MFRVTNIYTNKIRTINRKIDKLLEIKKNNVLNRIHSTIANSKIINYKSCLISL